MRKVFIILALIPIYIQVSRAKQDTEFIGNRTIFFHKIGIYNLRLLTCDQHTVNKYSNLKYSSLWYSRSIFKFATINSVRVLHNT